MSKKKLVSKKLIDQKSKYILVDLEKLKELLVRYPAEGLLTDFEAQALAERYLERIITRVIDINFHLIRSVGAPPPDDYTESFRELSRLKILPPKLAADLAPAAGARNILVHEYDDLDAVLFYSSLKAAVRLVPQYLRAVAEWLK